MGQSKDDQEQEAVDLLAALKRDDRAAYDAIFLLLSRMVDSESTNRR